MNTQHFTDRQKACDSAIRYLRAIRNPFKRAYGFDCLNAWLEGQPFPSGPAEISYLAAQAVRMTLDDTL